MYDVLAERIIEALLTTTTQRAAAALAGVSERTIQNYRKRADFQAEYEAAAARVMEERRAARQAEAAELAEARAVAIRALTRNAKNVHGKGADQIRAARILLDLTAPPGSPPEF